MFFLGLDIGTSSIKAAIYDAEADAVVAESSSPADEMAIVAREPGWAEQDPNLWWEHAVCAVRALPEQLRQKIAGVGVGYQMHGLVLVDSGGNSLRDAIIWCDSRAAPFGEQAFAELGTDFCSTHLLNSPGNFTASKMRWVLEHEPQTFARAAAALLPGDFIGFRLTGRAATTASGLSEMALWDFPSRRLSVELLDYFGISASLIPEVVPVFGYAGTVGGEAPNLLGIPKVPLLYRSGDQPNSAFGLGCTMPGQVAANAGTSGVLYGVTDQMYADPLGRVNTFLHANDQPTEPRNGVLCCLNGCGAMYRWIRKDLLGGRVSYDEMNNLAAKTAPGADGLLLYPFGNGAERILQNANPGASFTGVDLSRHGTAEVCRAAVEGIAFALKFGSDSGIRPSLIRAGEGNLFLSETFDQTFADVMGCDLQVCSVTGAAAAARGAAVAAGACSMEYEPRVIRQYSPQNDLREYYDQWLEGLAKLGDYGAPSAQPLSLDV